MNIDPEINQRAQAIRPLNIGTIMQLTGNRVGERRDLQQIIAVAEEWCADVRVVAAAFGFLRDMYVPDQFCDVLATDRMPPDAAPILDNGPEIRAAFWLAIVAYGGPVQNEYDVATSRIGRRATFNTLILNRIKANRAARAARKVN